MSKAATDAGGPGVEIPADEERQLLRVKPSLEARAV